MDIRVLFVLHDSPEGVVDVVCPLMAVPRLVEQDDKLNIFGKPKYSAVHSDDWLAVPSQEGCASLHRITVSHYLHVLSTDPLRYTLVCPPRHDLRRRGNSLRRHSPHTN